MKKPTRDRLVEIAASLMMTKSYQVITMNMVADAAGITAPTLYHYFEGKDVLLTEAGLLIKRELAAPFELKLPGGLGYAGKLTIIGHAMIDYMVKNKIPGACLVNDPVDKPMNLKYIREQVYTLVGEQRKATFLLGLMAAEVTMLIDMPGYSSNPNIEHDRFMERALKAIEKL